MSPKPPPTSAAPNEKTQLETSFPRLVIISAPSGAGKTTLCRMLLAEYENITLSISTTTRQRRPKEEDGVHYHFVNSEKFLKLIGENRFAEWAEVHGHCYGTQTETIENAINSRKHILFDIDYQGALNLRNLYPKRALLIFIHPPSMDVLENRLQNRGSDSKQTIETRMQNAYNEVEWSKSFDFQILNDNLEQAYQEIRKIIGKECR